MASYGEILNKLKANSLEEEYSLYNQGTVDWSSMGHGKADELKEGFCHGTCMDWARGLILGNDPKKNVRISDDSKYNNVLRGHAQLLFYMKTKKAGEDHVAEQRALIAQQQQIIDEEKEIELKKQALSTAWNKQDAQRTLLFNNYSAANKEYVKKATAYNNYVNQGLKVPPNVSKECDDAETFKNIQHQVYLEFNNKLNGRQAGVQSLLDGFNSQIESGNQKFSALKQQITSLKSQDLAPSTWKVFAVAMDDHMDKVAEKFAALEGKKKKKKRFTGIELKSHLESTEHTNLPTFASALNSSDFRTKTCMIIGFRFATVKAGQTTGEGGHAIAFYKATPTEGYFLEPNFGSFKVAVAKMPALMAYVIGPQAYGVLEPEAWVWNNKGGWELFVKDPSYEIVSEPTVHLKPTPPVVPIVKPPTVQQTQVKPNVVMPSVTPQVTTTQTGGAVKRCKKCDGHFPLSTRGWTCPKPGCGGGLVKIG